MELRYEQVCKRFAGTDALNARSFDLPALTHPFGGAGDFLLSPLARWDAVWYLDIAHSGYAGSSTAFTS